MKVFQIIIGGIPEYLESCVQSVENYCKRMQCHYCQVTEIPDYYQKVPTGVSTEYFRNRLIKDWICLDLLANEPDTMIIDWDIFLNSKKNQFSFVPGRYPAFAVNPMDCMMYNATDVGSFKKIRQLAGRIDLVMPGELLPAKSIRLFMNEKPDFKYTNFDNNQYKHIDNCRLMQ